MTGIIAISGLITALAMIAGVYYQRRSQNPQIRVALSDTVRELPTTPEINKPGQYANTYEFVLCLDAANSGASNVPIKRMGLIFPNGQRPDIPILQEPFPFQIPTQIEAGKTVQVFMRRREVIRAIVAAQLPQRVRLRAYYMTELGVPVFSKPFTFEFTDKDMVNAQALYLVQRR